MAAKPRTPPPVKGPDATQSHDHLTFQQRRRDLEAGKPDEAARAKARDIRRKQRQTLANRLPEEDGEIFCVWMAEADHHAVKAAEYRRRAWAIYHEHVAPGAQRPRKTARKTARTKLREAIEEMLG